ncbi:MATE family efflux transporter [Ruminococcus sp.]|uniref:MATE family efflux transporter n=1 Tax=Ruminococcus sp. TaxID=41978 RepID=UPI0038904A43
MSELSQNKMGVKPMLPLLLGMSLPAMFSMMIQALYNVVDSIFVARYSPDALQAVSLAYPLQMILISFGVGTAVGVNSLIARRLGAKNYHEANTAATTGLVLAVFNWLVFLLLGLTVSRPFISMFTADTDVINDGTSYLTIVMCVSFGMMISCMGEKILQSTGNMIFPMLTQTLGAVVNIIFDPLLIFGIGFFPRMGVTGAAIATVFGQICSMTFILIVLFVRKHEIKITFKGFRLQKPVLKNIYAVGFPAIIMQCIGSVMVSGINAIISLAKISAAYTAAYINAFGIYFKLQSFVFMPVFGLNQGVSPIIGYNYGARDKKRMYSAFRLGIIIAAAIMAAGTLLFQLAPGWLLSLFESGDAANAASNALLAEVGVPVLRIISLSFMFAAVGIMFATLFQAVGKGFYSMAMSVMRQLVVLLPVAFLLSKINMVAMWYAFPIAEIFCLGVAVVFFLKLRKKEFSKLS